MGQNHAVEQPPTEIDENKPLTKTQKRRRAEKCKRKGTVVLLQAQLDATTTASANALATATAIHKKLLRGDWSSRRVMRTRTYTNPSKPP